MSRFSCWMLVTWRSSLKFMEFYVTVIARNPTLPPHRKWWRHLRIRISFTSRLLLVSFQRLICLLVQWLTIFGHRFINRSRGAFYLCPTPQPHQVDSEGLTPRASLLIGLRFHISHDLSSLGRLRSGHHRSNRGHGSRRLCWRSPQWDSDVLGIGYVLFSLGLFRVAAAFVLSWIIEVLSWWASKWR